MNLKLSDVQGDPCECALCVLAGVTDRPIRRDPSTGKWLHGLDLRKWWAARDAFVEQVNARRQPRGRAGDFVRLTKEDPSR